MKSKIIDFIFKNGLLIFFIILIIGIILNLTRFNFLFGFDFFWYVNPFFLNRLFVWNNINTGFFYQIGDLMPLGLFYYFFHLFSIGNKYIQTFYIVFLYLGGFLSFYFFSRKLLKANLVVALLSSFLYIFNLYAVISYFHDRLFPILVVFPIMFYIYHRILYEKKIYLTLIIPLLSLVCAGSNVNPAVVLPFYGVLFIYLIFYLFFENISKNDFRTILKLHSVLLVIFLLLNFWWLSTFIPSMLDVSEVGAKVNSFRALGSGYFFDHFRAVGYWGWYSSHNLYRYFSYSLSYYSPLLLATSFSIVIFSLVFLFKLRDSKFFNSEQKKIYLFFFLIFIIGLFLANGTKGEMGEVFSYLYNLSSLFWMFREPWTKFTPLICVSSAVLLCASLSVVAQKINNKKIIAIFYLIVFSFELINIYPLLTREAIFDKWNGSMRSQSVSSVPSYWLQLRDYLDINFLQKENILSTPLSFTYMAYNWEQGLTAAENPAVVLLKNPILRNASFPMYKADVVVNQIYSNIGNKDFNLKNYLSLLGTRFILQENDADWRYAGGWNIQKPVESESNIISSGYDKVVEFGKFESNQFLKISNDEPNKKLKDEMYSELKDKPALILFKQNDNNYLKLFYTPENILISSSSVQDLHSIVSVKDYKLRTATFFENDNLNNQSNWRGDLGVAKENLIATTSIIRLKINPVVEYKKINPTKYRVVLHGFSGILPLIFSQNYHKNWNMYLSNYRPDDLMNTNNYESFSNADINQTTKDDLNYYISQGWVSSAGGGLSKKNSFYSWSDGLIKEDGSLKYVVDYISKNTNGTIENYNLKDGNFYETWLKKPIINESSHLVANGYANSWLLDANKICYKNLNCKKNADGTYDFELVIEFWPQRLFYIGVFVSSVTLIGCIAYLFVCFRRSNLKK